ncbi:MAG: S8 family serine peptidase [Actinomycetota bacterium]
MRIIVAGALVSALVLGGAIEATAARGDAQRSRPNGVVAIIDTGINPYHQTFRDNSARAYRHPSTYIPGYPSDAIALPITLDEPDYWTAVEQDCESIWAKVEPGKLYWFPGTKIIGALTLEKGIAGFPAAPIDCSNPRASFADRSILDFSGHGTMTASRAASVEYGACRSCLLVAVQGFNTDSVAWAADNSHWIDAQSNSWGRFLPVWVPVAADELVTNDPQFVRIVEDAARRHLAFWASGNGALTRGGVLGHPTILDPRMTPSVVMVGGHDSGYVNLWPAFPPHVVADSCNSWAAYHTQTEQSDENVGSGTSAASPWAAGGATRILLEARRILGDRDTGIESGMAASGRAGLVAEGPLADGVFTLEEWKEVTYRTASARPEGQREDGSVCSGGAGYVIYDSTPVRWEDVPAEYPEYLHIGYGAVDAQSLQLAFSVLRGVEPVPDRGETDDYFAMDAQVRGALHAVYRGP